jgi:hypothetical protein
MNLKKQLRTHIEKANIPDVSKAIIDQLPHSKVFENSVFKKRPSFILQFSAFLILILGVSVFSYQQVSSQIYAFSEYEEVLGISVVFMDTYFEIEVDENLPLSLSLEDQLDIDEEIQYMLSYMRIFENLVLTQNKVIQSHRFEANKEKYVVTFDTMNQSHQSIEIEVEKSFKNFNQDVFEFEAIFNDIELLGYTEFNNQHHTLHLSAFTETKQMNVSYDSLDKMFEVSMIKDGQEAMIFNYQILRNNLNQPTLLLHYFRNEKDISLTINYLPIRRKMDVSYIISDELRQSSGRFEVSFMMHQRMSLIVKGKTDNGDVFEYQFQRNQMDFNENQ